MGPNHHVNHESFERQPLDVAQRESDWKGYTGQEAIPMAHGQEVSLLPGDNYSRKLFVFRRQQLALLFALSRFSLRSRSDQPGTCWDVGANLGYLSAYLALRTDVADILAFEPNAAVHAVLQRNAQRYPKIVPFQVAIGAISGQVELHIDVDDSGLSSTAPFKNPDVRQDEDQSGAPEVATLRSLDSIWSEHAKGMAFLKIDVEGGEPEVLLGGQAVLREFLPLILLEWHNLPGHRSRILEAFHEALGSNQARYRFFGFDHDGCLFPLSAKESLNAQIADIFFVPEGCQFRA